MWKTNYYALCNVSGANTNSCIQHGDLRLVGGISAFDGRVEICSKDRVWNRICNDGWDRNDATVVCRQLGLSPVGKSYNNIG